MIKIPLSGPVTASAPCRIDMGGTLDISTFHYPLRRFGPCTVNIALNLRTRVTLLRYTAGKVKVSSRGFESAEHVLGQVPFDHPMGLMFAIAAYFNAEGIHIVIDSQSPPKSALGGSSVAAVALVAAFLKASGELQDLTDRCRCRVARLAYAIEASVAGVPCGFQDQLAAVYGGVNIWHWPADGLEAGFRQEPLWDSHPFGRFEKHLLIAYCGIPHESKNVNSAWVRQFISGQHREKWIAVAGCVQKFAKAVRQGRFKAAAAAMNAETDMRIEMTPDVLDRMGRRLVDTARRYGCGARFTGAGGGGCIWAIGAVRDIHRLRDKWATILSQREAACLLETAIDKKGVSFD